MCELRMSVQSVVFALAIALVFLSPSPSMGFPPGDPGPDHVSLDLENYDLNSETDWENLDLNIYGESYDYDDLDQETSRQKWRGLVSIKATIQDEITKIQEYIRKMVPSYDLPPQAAEGH